MKTSSYMKMALAAFALALATPAFAEPTPAPDLKDILGGAGGALGNVLEGVFTKTDLTVEDIAGEWTSTGSAVSFQSDNFLKKAGGSAAAGAVENKLDTYYKKFGLTGAVLKVEKDGTFSLTIKKVPLKGTLEVKEKGEFHFNFNAGGMMKLGSMTAYVEKTPTGLNVMFDADKLKKIMTLAANLSGSKMVSTADKLLKEYDGICIGFKMTGQGSSSGASSSEGTDTAKPATDDAVKALKGLFGK